MRKLVSVVAILLLACMAGRAQYVISAEDRARAAALVEKMTL